jgi:hypothetical protein
MWLRVMKVCATTTGWRRIISVTPTPIRTSAAVRASAPRSTWYSNAALPGSPGIPNSTT